MKPATTLIISGGMNALRLPGFFENLGPRQRDQHGGWRSYGHTDSPAAGAKSSAPGPRVLEGQGRPD